MVKLTSHKRSVCLIALAILLLGVVPVASGVWLTGTFAHGQPDQATTTSTTTTPVGSIVFTSPSSGGSFAGPQSYTISGTISPTPPSRDNVSILVTLLGSSSAVDSSTQAVTASGTFSYSTQMGGASWVTGTYVISATDSHGATGLTTFEYTAPAVTTTTTTTTVTGSTSSSTISTSTTVSTVGSITFTSPSSGSSFVGPQGYTIGGTISPSPSLPDNMSIDVTLLGSSASLGFATERVTASGTFSYSTQMGGASWVTGTYVISATDSHGATGLTTFEYTAPAVTTTTTTSTTTASSSTSTTSSSTATSTSTTSTTTKTTSTSVSTTTTSSQPPTTTTVTQTVTPAPFTITSTTTTTPAPSTLTNTSIQTVTSTVTQTSSVIPDWAYGAMVVLLLAGLAVGYVVKGSSARKG